MKVFEYVSSYWRDVFLQASGNTVAQVVGVLGIPLLSRLYAPQEFALQSIFLQLVMFFAGVMTWRYEYFFQMLKDDQQARWLLSGIIKLGIVSGVVLTIALYAFSAEISQLLSVEQGANLLLIAPVSAFLVSLALAFQHNAQRLGDYKISALSEVFGKSSYVASGALLATVSTSGLVFTTLFSALGKIGALLRYSKDLIYGARVHAPNTMSPFKKHASGANAMVMSHVLVTVSSAAPIFFISAVYGTEVLGQFSMVMATIFLPSGLIGAAIGQVFYQRAASHAEEPLVLRGLWNMTIRKLTLFGVPIYLCAGILSPWLYPFVLGSQWGDAGLYAQVLMVAALSAFVSTPLDRVSLVLRYNWYMPALHVFRLTATGVLLALATHFALDFKDFLLFYVVQVSAVYLLDLLFAHFLIVHAVRNGAAAMGES
ncbi:O-antigen flippase Wzx [Pseudomonas sp. XWY-1]|uniref:lipopolysaccharide biosynthesis protein n=1 Tax=Pseudomonas TaxID=286 RepID=UPI000CDC78F6|nr:MULTISPECIES: oligosaccharide flippase family protein [Pseudomonas]QNV66586.1 oligosaccharide flippase family protein [Pseudomonas sp. CFA]AUZ60667.1 O-antigen flippase Wzx [Pseudomonas sp. XWY-1]MCX2816092.1 oligosaccharide flippase family protein [Pseudomonas sp. DCB_E]MCX9142822.1 oligosaccharide flippase family protein [Pseudomonas sp. DCB_Q]MDD2004279.1 oligosaccharide flippase family protein [Pseudomonas putida]